MTPACNNQAGRSFNDTRLHSACSVLILGCLLGFVLPGRGLGQAPSPSSQPASPAWSPSQSTGVFAFARNGQSAEQQLKDESECYGLAKQRTGIDRQSSAPRGKSAEQKAAEQQAAADNAKQMKGGRAAGAARGAAGGAAIGAIAGDAGKGAGAGAVAGTRRGGMAQRQANAAAQKQAEASCCSRDSPNHGLEPSTRPTS